MFTYLIRYPKWFRGFGGWGCEFLPLLLALLHWFITLTWHFVRSVVQTLTTDRLPYTLPPQSSVKCNVLRGMPVPLATTYMYIFVTEFVHDLRGGSLVVEVVDSSVQHGVHGPVPWLAFIVGRQTFACPPDSGRTGRDIWSVRRAWPEYWPRPACNERQKE